MFRSKYISILICVLWGFTLQAQIYLNETRSPILNFGLLVEDDSFVLNGIVTRPDTVCGLSVHRDRMYTRFDFNGNLLDSLIITNAFCGGAGHRGDLFRLNDSIYFQSGWSGNYADSPEVSAELHLIKSDLSDTAQTIRFQVADSSTTNWLFSDVDQQERIIGLGYFGNDTNSNYGFFVPWIFRIDTDLTIESLRTISSTNTRGYLPSSMALGPNGQIAIGVQDYKSFDENDYDGLVIVMDSTGQELWRHRMWTQPDRYDCGPEVFATSDGNYVVAQQRAYEDASAEPIYYIQNRIAVKKLSPTGAILWEKEYGNSDTLIPGQINPSFQPNFRPYVIKENQAGEIFIGGTNFVWSGVLKLSSTGDSLWYREVRDREGNSPNDLVNNPVWEVNYLYDMEFLGDSAILVAGQYQTDPGGAVYPNGAQRNWFALLDQYGCDSVGCQYINIIEPHRPKQELVIYPNPVSDILRVEGSVDDYYEVYDVLGRLVLQGTLEDEIDVSKLPSGTYILRVGNESRKFVRE